ncbi:hypothetical protein [Sphingobacterium cellulitidis]|uniref:hypothetical protein n=1 Tax=Sphingobacterium cellulitidis TaxID=1768011 RepID=UPI00146E88E4
MRLYQRKENTAYVISTQKISILTKARIFTIQGADTKDRSGSKNESSGSISY